jgi:REP element-mobilizing transposase RayT
VAVYIRKTIIGGQKMARTARVKSTGAGTAYYHLMSRASNRQFLFSKSAAKDRLMDITRRAAEFSGVKLIAVTIMDNHFHILCSVTRSSEPVPQEEIIRRVGVLKGEKAAEKLSEHLERLSAAGFTSMLEAELDGYRRRMGDISAFMKTLKELFAVWYNREYRYCGSIWSGVFKSTMVESGKYLEYCRRYVMMNPVRAGIVTRIKAYRWVWSDMPSENEVFLGFNPRGEGKVAQIGSGKIFGSVGFVVKWIDAMGFTAKRTVAHAVGDVGYSSHGWRLAKRESEAAAS